MVTPFCFVFDAKFIFGGRGGSAKRYATEDTHRFDAHFSTNKSLLYQ